MQEKTWYQIGKLNNWGQRVYQDIGNFAKNYKKYRNESEASIYRIWGGGSDTLIADQVAINIKMLKTIALQNRGPEGLKRAKTMLNWALVTRASNVKTNFKHSKIRLSFSDIKSVKKSGGITTALPE